LQQTNGKKWVIRTTEGAQIKDAIMTQAVALKEKRDAEKKKEKVRVLFGSAFRSRPFRRARLSADALLLWAPQEEAAAKAAAEAAAAAERAKFLTFEQLKNKDYAGCTRLPVDEKTKEDWLTDAEFQQVCSYLDSNRVTTVVS
jgi:hypothetical protein